MHEDINGYVRANVTCESGIQVLPPKLITAIAATPIQLLPEEVRGNEYTKRQIQNVGTTNIYVAVGLDKPVYIGDATKDLYHFVLPPLATYGALDTLPVYAVCPDAALIVSTFITLRTPSF